MLGPSEIGLIENTFGKITPSVARIFCDRLKTAGVVSRYGRPYTVWSIIPVLTGRVEHLPTEIEIIEIIREEIKNFQLKKEAAQNLTEIDDAPKKGIRKMKRRKSA